ncbi:MAG: aminotransferase class I/II-fold pyridoxal phosphate-dependent enzyme [Clostridia bacterium]|nr:aminotransferase class I/II-fold pyridoxal phosphate-dependent enzyme [Clostridia bacterium]
MRYSQANAAALEAEYAKIKTEYEHICSLNLKLDLSRGKPCAEQLALNDGILQTVASEADCFAEDGTDCRNYGNLNGLPEMRRLFSELTSIKPERIMIGGNSSLGMMYDTISRAMIFGLGKSPRPWSKEEKLKFLCPAPGYDRHFAITELFGFELITVDMTETGPDMDQVEALVKADSSIKGIWCVPMYANPTGVTYTDETVRRLVKMETAAPDFVIMWDNAYAIHDLVDEHVDLLDIFAEAEKYGTEDRVLYFTSFSKVTYAGGAIAMMAMSDANMKVLLPIQNVRTIGYDKVNQLRHVLFLKDKETTMAHMRKHSAIVGRKVSLLHKVLESELQEAEIAEWTYPRGGYFVSMNVADGCAKRVYNLCKEAGVTLTNAGATFPYGIDPRDRNLRLAPTYPSDADLESAAKVLCLAVRLATLEKLLQKA